MVTGYEKNPRRAEELKDAMDSELADSYRAVASNPNVQILVVTCDPCDKLELVELAAEAGKAVFINKPLCHTPSAARQLVEVIRKANIPAVFDAPMIKFLPAFHKLMQEVRAGRYGEVVSYFHSFGMTIAHDFPIVDQWPERFDHPRKSGGGEMTNMGCYAIDYALHVLGTPQRVEARWQKFWEPYRKADVENFGQILLDYDRFWGVLSVGKQMVQTERGQRNALTIEFENRTIVLAMDSGFILVNGHPQPLEEYLCAHHCDSAIDQLLRCIEEGQRRRATSKPQPRAWKCCAPPTCQSWKIGRFRYPSKNRGIHSLSE